MATQRYNAKVRPITFLKGDLVWRMIGDARKGVADGKFVPNWEGPYRVN